MSAVTATITGGGPGGWMKKWMDKRKEKMAAKGEAGAAGGGGGAHTHGSGGKAAEAEVAAAEPAEAPVEETVAEEPAPTTMKSSPAKIKKVGYGYKPFEMKAKKHNNSPIQKNYGSPAQRGFNQMAAFGTKSNEMDGGVGSAFDYASSPAKGWLSNIGKGLKKFAKKAIDPLGLKDKAKKALGIGGAEAAPAGVQPHGDEAHTGGGGETAMGAAQAAQTADPETGALPGDQRKLEGFKKHKFGRVGGGGGGGGIGNAISGVTGLSDIRAKEKIERTGESPSGIPMYEFNYIGGSNRYSGVMAQDLLEMNIDAVSLGEDGYYRVNYNNIDVDMRII